MLLRVLDTDLRTVAHLMPAAVCAVADRKWLLWALDTNTLISLSCRS